uniref:H(+)-exporting diphosphatase n=1 Tax=Hirondellea gigas TaxID=1518452 RepID=A0A2P2HYL2_9CRUS
MALLLDDTGLLQAIPVAAVAVAFGFATALFITIYRVLNREAGGKLQRKIAQDIQDGAQAFLKQEYIFLTLFVLMMTVVVGFAMRANWLASSIAFVSGALLSAICGYSGMMIAVKANVRTTEAAREGLGSALQVAFASGSVMGLIVVSCGLFGIIIFYSIWGGITSSETSYLAGFGFGASSIALFARVGGGIYTKAADVGADLVGKVEASIPEDDPRNPATIADNVGDNVGDVAGMGADLFESFVGSLIAAIQLAANDDLSIVDVKRRIALPFWIAGFGLISSIIGVFLVKISDEADCENLQEKLLGAIRKGIFAAAFLSAILSYVSCGVLFGFGSLESTKLFGCIVIGLMTGILIGISTEYCTSFSYKPTVSIAKKTRLGPSAVIIQGLGIGMLSTIFPVIFVFIALISTSAIAGTYGIAIAAVGMLATLGVTLATDAFGPVADNAGGIAEMAKLPKEVRDRTDALDALGNTTAATGKGFAIGSAVLTSFALLSSFAKEANVTDVKILDANVLAGAIFGACLPYVFAAMTMMAVARSAGVIIQEVRRQFAEIEGLLEGTAEADFIRCVDISTRSSLIEMVTPGLLAIVAPIFIGFLLGPGGLLGMLVGGIISGFVLAVSMANSGGAWDNAKKFIEAEGLGSKEDNKAKGSDLHKAAIVGDTVGDPFKDTSGPSLNILIKLMSIISLVFASVFKDRKAFEYWWVALIIGVVFLTFVVVFTLWMRRSGMGKINFEPTAEVAVKEENISADAVGVEMEDIDIDVRGEDCE